MTREALTGLIALILVPIFVSSELKLVQVLFRHGDRAPTAGYEKWYPTDPHINEDYAPAGLGGLTEEGRERAYFFGKLLRRRYFSRLHISEYSSSIFRARSSDVDRCRFSAEAAIAALFPKTESIPIFYRPVFEDPLFLGIHICPVVSAEKDRVEKSVQVFEPEKRWASLYRYLSGHLGLNATRYHAFILHHTLMAQKSMGLTLPRWTNKIYPSELLERNAGYEYVIQSYSTKLKRVNGGMWIREFTKNMDDVISGKDEAKMLLYVGHETNIAGLLTALGSFQPHVPTFCSSVILELHQDPRSGQYFVRLFYKNTENFEELYIPRCSTPCPFEDFKILTHHLIPKDINLECGLVR